MKNLLLALALVAPSHLLAAETYVTPVVTARVANRIYSTTTAFRNDGPQNVSCEAAYAPSNDPNGGTLRSTYEIGARKTIVEERTLMAAGALGTLRLVCSAPVTITARIHTSLDKGRTFDAGLSFLAASEANRISFGTPRVVATTTDLLVMEVAGIAADFDITARDRSGAIVLTKSYHLPAFAPQVIDLSTILAGAPVLQIEITVAENGGSVVVTGLTTEPTLAAMTAPRRDQRQKPRTLNGTAIPPPSQQLSTSSFKGTPFHDPATGLVYMRDRWYDPPTGSFLTPDPEGFADSANAYVYCGGDPVNCSDPSGRAATLGRNGWIVATNNQRGGAIRRFSPAEIAKDPLAVRRFLSSRSDVTAREADDILTRAGYGAWLGNEAGIRAAAIGAETAKPVVEATATGLSIVSGFTGVGGIAQVAQSLLDDGTTKANIAMAGLTVVGLGATDDIARLGTLTDEAVEIFSVVPYRPSLPGVEQHHGVLDVWASANVPGYVSRGGSTPSVVLTATQHAATKQVYREWLFARTGRKVGGKVDWSNVSPQEIQALTDRMFDAADVPAKARQEYYRAFNEYIYGR